MSERISVKVQKVSADAVMPYYEHEGDSGVDLFSVEDKLLKPGERALVSTGIRIALPPGYEAQVRPKSGLAIKSGITVLNTPGTVDAGYRGDVCVIMINHSDSDFKVEKGKKIAQMVFQKVESAAFEEVNSLDETSRGEGGFGSTGLERKNAKD
jgi:dUTP pyrophosphatase